jgi:TatA/E family protein of Tat protein translocase
MGARQPGYLIVIIVVVLIIFGPGKLANVGKSLGERVREFRKALTSAPIVARLPHQRECGSACPRPPRSSLASERYCTFTWA